MMLRAAVFGLSAAVAYPLLRGWPEVLPGIMRGCLAVLVLVAGLGIWARRPPGENEAAAKGRRAVHWLDYAVIGGVVLAVECGFLWLLGSAPRPLETVAMGIERHFRPEAAALRAVSGGPAAARPGNWLWTQETRRPLPKRTDFKPGRKPEVFVRLQDRADAAGLLTGKVYVRAFALGRYEHAAWSPLPGRVLEIRADDSGDVRVAPERPGRTIFHEVFHAADAAGQNPLTALQGVTTARISPLRRVDDGLHLLPPPTGVGGYQYVAGSCPMRIEDLPDGRLIRGWPGAANDFLSIPDADGLGAKLRELARQAAGSGGMKEQLLGIRNHLRATLEYSLETANRRDLDPIENFLFEEKRGHCEYFATAAALMARSLGIPSRVAYGWAGGTWFEDPGLFVFRANEAHAWTEVWLETYGWVILDPTPQAAIGDRAQVAAPNEKLPDATTGPTSPDPSLAVAADAELPSVALWLMAGFTVPALLVAWLRGGRRFQDAARAAGTTETPGAGDPGYLQNWRRACAARGWAMPPGSTLRHHLDRLPELPEFAAELLDYHYGTRYEGRAADPRTEHHLSRKIRAWEKKSSGINHASPPPIRAHE